MIIRDLFVTGFLIFFPAVLFFSVIPGPGIVLQLKGWRMEAVAGLRMGGSVAGHYKRTAATAVWIGTDADRPNFLNYLL